MAIYQVVILAIFVGVLNGELIPGYKQGLPSDTYFKLHKTALTWDLAFLMCQSENGQLSEISSPEKAKLFSEELLKITASEVKDTSYLDQAFIGLDKRIKNEWATISALMFYKFSRVPLAKSGHTKWGPGEPSGDGVCATILKNGNLNDVPCELKMMFFCESRHPYTEERTSEPEPVCEDWGNGYKLGQKSGERFYKVHTKVETWHVANLVCQAEGAHLAILRSENDAKFYSRVFNAINKDTITGTLDKYVVLLGFDKLLPGKNEFVTLDGLTLREAGYAKWSPGQPDNPITELCGSMFWNGLLNDITCTSPYVFICEKSSILGPNKINPQNCVVKTTLTDAEATEGLVCEKTNAGYVRGFSDGCRAKYYKFFLEPATWYDALFKCQAEGATLAMPESDEDAKVLSTIFARYPPSSIPGDFDKDVALVGFNDIVKEGEYRNLKGKLLKDTHYFKWSPGQPDNSGGNENCGNINRDVLLNDISCSPQKYMFFCQKEYDICPIC